MSPWLFALVCVQALPQGKLCLRPSYAEFGAYATTLTSSTQARSGWPFSPGDSEMSMEKEEVCGWMNELAKVDQKNYEITSPEEECLGQVRRGRDSSTMGRHEHEQYPRVRTDYLTLLKRKGFPLDRDFVVVGSKETEFVQGELGLELIYMCEASEGHSVSEASMSNEIDDEALSLMQTADDSQAWFHLSGGAEVRLDSMDKFDRAVHTSFLLRKLDWHATDSSNGYLLGHMGGRTAQMTALLVAYQDNVEVDTEAPVPTLAAGAWAEMETFLPAHPGSMRRQGKPLPLEEPCVMLSMREVPSEFLTLGYDSTAEDKEDGRRKKRKQSLMVEISSGSSDCPVLTRRVRVPLVDGEADLRFHFKIQNDTESETSETVPASSVEAVGTTLSVPAPQNLGEAGLSLVELWRMEAEWRAGDTTTEQLVQCYGRQVAGDMLPEVECGPWC